MYEFDKNKVYKFVLKETRANKRYDKDEVDTSNAMIKRLMVFVDYFPTKTATLAIFKSKRGGYVETFTEAQLQGYRIEPV